MSRRNNSQSHSGDSDDEHDREGDGDLISALGVTLSPASDPREPTTFGQVEEERFFISASHRARLTRTLADQQREIDELTAENKELKRQVQSLAAATDSHHSRVEPTSRGRGRTTRPVHAPRRGDVEVCLRLKPGASVSNLNAFATVSESNVSLYNLSVFDNTLRTTHSKYGLKEYNFDQIFNVSASNSDVYDHFIRRNISAVLGGSNVFVLCYGQIGSGKTYTLYGQDGASGLIINAIKDLFARLETTESNLSDVFNVDIRCSAVQVYCNKLYDLHNTDTIIIKNIQAATQVAVNNATDAMSFIQRACSRRTTQSTSLNDTSSRSHFIFNVELTRADVDTLTRSQITFVDLAGTEGAQKDAELMSQSNDIRLGVLALRKCIQALRRPRGHVPWLEHMVCIDYSFNSLRFRTRLIRALQLTKTLKEYMATAKVTVIITARSSHADEYQYRATDESLQFANEACFPVVQLLYLRCPFFFVSSAPGSVITQI